MAHIIVQKAVMFSPLQRLEKEWNRLGVPISRQDMSNWILKCSELYFEPIRLKMADIMRTGSVLHADETTLQVLRDEEHKPINRKGYIWLYRTSGDAEHPIVIYDYQQGRSATHPAEFLKNYNGYLHTDGYAGYHRLPEGITVVGCWAHARRYFEEAAQALNYAQKQRKNLEAVLLDGRLELSNNRAERSIKPFVIGRKNFLFANTERGAKAAANMYSLVETAPENGLDPYKYLTWLLETASRTSDQEHWEDAVLPWNAPDFCKVKQPE